VWQSLFGDMKDHGFTVLAVAMDQPETARPWIEAAAATYPCLIDRDHHLADLYNMVNVPQAVWIDEEGRIVRPPETAGSMDAFRAMDRKTFTIPDEVTAERNRIKTQYFDAARDWVLRGSGSVHAMNAIRAAEKLKLPDATIAEAHAWFHLGRYLLREGHEAEAQVQMAEASRLHPDSWAMWRQAAAKDTRGLASGSEFWKRVDALGSRSYYPPAEIDDMT
jgi:AhpC/TSA family